MALDTNARGLGANALQKAGEALEKIASLTSIQILNKGQVVSAATESAVQTVATNFIVANYGRQPKALDGLIITITATSDKVLYTYSEVSKLWVNVGLNIDLSGYVATTEQTFTDEQKAQARANIGAVANVQFVYDGNKITLDGVEQTFAQIFAIVSNKLFVCTLNFQNNLLFYPSAYDETAIWFSNEFKEEGSHNLCRVIINTDNQILYDQDTVQDKLTFDDTPTSGSTNPVKSNGIYLAFNGLKAKYYQSTSIANLTYMSELRAFIDNINTLGEFHFFDLHNYITDAYVCTIHVYTQNNIKYCFVYDIISQKMCGNYAGYADTDTIANYLSQNRNDTIKSIKLTDNSMTLGGLNDMLTGINSVGDHIFFDVALLNVPQMYLCTIYIDTTNNIYKAFDLISLKAVTGVYDADKLLVIALNGASEVALQSQIDNLQDQINSLSQDYTVKSYEQLANDIESGASADYIDFGDKMNMNWISSVSGQTTSGGLVTCSDLQTFINKMNECENKSYLFIYDGTNWTYNEEVIALSDYALSISGTPKAGDVATVNTIVEANNVTFTGYDVNTLGTGETGKHNWCIEETYCRLGTFNFDAPESAICITVGKTLPAGKYYIYNVAESTSDWWCNYKRQYYLFEIPNDITATEATGDIQLRRTSIGNRETTGDARGVYQIYCKPYKCIDDNLLQDITISFVGQLTAPSEEYTDLRTITDFSTDQTMTNTGIIYNNLGHACYGNNEFNVSNLYQLLNSAEKSMTPVRLHKNDVVTGLKGRKGYLYGLDPRAKAIMRPIKLSLEHGVSDEFTRYSLYTFETTVYLLTMKQMSFNIQTDEGTVTQLYSDYCGGSLNNNAVVARGKYNKSGGSLVNYRWASSAVAYDSYISWGVASSGGLSDIRASRGYYFSPAFNFAKNS